MRPLAGNAAEMLTILPNDKMDWVINYAVISQAAKTKVQVANAAVAKNVADTTTATGDDLTAL